MTGNAERAAFVDLLRGMVIVLMVLDHTRDYFHSQALLFDPTNLSQTNPALFATRWVTHLCATTFVFLSGVSIRLQQIGGKTDGALQRHLFTRGLWLIALELTVVSFGFNFAVPFIFLQVIWAIGAGMVLMSLLIRAPRPVLVVVGLGLLATAYHGASVQPGGAAIISSVWRLLFVPGLNPVAPGLAVYPLLPWFAMMLTGYAIGDVFHAPDQTRRRLLLIGATGLVWLWLLLRSFNLYGDPRPWTPQADAVSTAMSFLNVSKYPPSLQFGMVTIGVAVLVALALERWAPRRLGEVLSVFGRTSLFTYLLHIYVVHGLALGLGWAMGFRPSDFLDFLGDPARLIDAGWGVSLPVVFLIWLVIVAVLYPAARRYDALKSSRRVRWTSYL